MYGCSSLNLQAITADCTKIALLQQRNTIIVADMRYVRSVKEFTL